MDPRQGHVWTATGCPTGCAIESAHAESQAGSALSKDAPFRVTRLDLMCEGCAVYRATGFAIGCAQGRNTD
eukprot:7545870-Pyramimonas_sp.AAC.1